MIRRGPMLHLLLACCTSVLVVGCGGDAGGDVTGPPASADQDSDGVLDEDDGCPTQPETTNHWKDDDGCPDNTEELYQFARTDIEEYWQRAFAASNGSYNRIQVFQGYTTQIETPCGPAVPRNAFFCPLNRGVYYHVPLLDGFLEVGAYASHFVIAHEIGHAVQNQLGFTRQFYPTILLELQADCFGGAYTRDARNRDILDQADVEAAVVGLFRIGDPIGTPWFDPQAHGTSGQRIDAFNIGVDQGVEACALPASPPPPPPSAAITTTTISSDDPDPSEPGQSVSVTVIVTSDAGIPNGSVTVTTIGSAESCVGTLSNGSVTCTLALGSEGTRTLFASYAGNSNFAPSSDTEAHAVEAPGPEVGQLQVTTTTTGSDQDPDGYRFALDGGQGQPIGVNGTASLTNIAVGPHSVTLSNVAGNCAVAGGASKTVSITAGATATVAFNITCSPLPPATGSIRVTTSTTGSDLDPDGYRFSIDGGQTHPIGRDADELVGDIPAGTHTVQLSEIADNCSVGDGSSRIVTLQAGETETADFVINCSALPPTNGAIRVTTATGGSDLDPNGYQFAIDGGSNRAIGLNGTVTVSDIATGSHTVVLSGVASNCGVADGPSKDVAVTAGQTSDVAFSITCTSTGPSGSQSSMVAEPKSIPTGGNSTITVTVRNASAGPVANTTVTLSSSGTGNSFSPASASTNASGVATFSFVSTVAENKTITATAGGVTLNDTEVITVFRRSSTIQITGDQNDPSAPGEAISVTFTVTIDGGGTPTGTVDIFSLEEGDVGCTVDVSAGACTFALNTAVLHHLQASYSGDVQFEDSSDPDGEEHLVSSAPSTISGRLDR